MCHPVPFVPNFFRRSCQKNFEEMLLAPLIFRQICFQYRNNRCRRPTPGVSQRSQRGVVGHSHTKKVLRDTNFVKDFFPCPVCFSFPKFFAKNGFENFPCGSRPKRVVRRRHDSLTEICNVCVCHDFPFFLFCVSWYHKKSTRDSMKRIYHGGTISANVFVLPFFSLWTNSVPGRIRT